MNSTLPDDSPSHDPEIDPMAARDSSLPAAANQDVANPAAPTTPVAAAPMLVEPEWANPVFWVAPLMAYLLVPTLLGILGISSDSDKVYPGPRPVASDISWLGVVITQVAVAGGMLLWWFRHYLTALPWRFSVWSWPLGVIGVLIWLLICGLEIEIHLAQSFPFLQNLMPARSSINPNQSFPDPTLFWVFLAFRFTGLVIVVPIAEELMLRGFFLRYVQDGDWWRQPLSRLAVSAIVYSSFYGMITHPTDALAAIVWFAGVTAWVRWQNKFWDGVIIHAVTNLLLGIYVLQYQQWHLW